VTFSIRSGPLKGWEILWANFRRGEGQKARTQKMDRKSHYLANARNAWKGLLKRTGLSVSAGLKREKQ